MTDSMWAAGSNPWMNFGPELRDSRQLLLDVLRLLEDQSDALTVLGAHAVYEQTKFVKDLPPMDSTADADLGVSPVLLVDTPRLDEVMSAAGLEPIHPDRPGVWGFTADEGQLTHQRMTIDLIAPASVAGGGRRAAEVGRHGSRSVSKTHGTELSLIDRQWLELEAFSPGEPSGYAWVAGRAALICAKAYKIFDRLGAAEFARNPQRYRPKDVADLFRLMAASEGTEVRAVFAQGEADPQIATAVLEGRKRLLELAERDEGKWLAGQVVEQWSDGYFSRQQIQDTFDRWFRSFVGVP